MQTVYGKIAEKSGAETLRAERLPNLLREALPVGIVRAADRIPGLEEIRLCTDSRPVFRAEGRYLFGDTGAVSEAEVRLVFHRLSDGCPYAHADTLAEGYLSLPDGIRVGVAGRANRADGRVTGLFEVGGICIRLPERIPVPDGTARRLLEKMQYMRGILVFSPPGVGKTTWLRRNILGCIEGDVPVPVAVADEREELCFPWGRELPGLMRLTAFPKSDAITLACRTLCPAVIFCDEIGAGEAEAVKTAVNCGVPLTASVHAGSLEELYARSAFASLLDTGAFGYALRLRRDGHGGFCPTVYKKDGEGARCGVNSWVRGSSL